MRRFLGLRWLTIGLIMLGAMVNFLSRATLAVAAPTVMTNLHIMAGSLAPSRAASCCSR